MHGMLKMWKGHIKTQFHGQDVPYNMYYNATAVLKILSKTLYTNKVKTTNPTYMLKGVNTLIQKASNVAC